MTAVDLGAESEAFARSIERTVSRVLTEAPLIAAVSAEGSSRFVVRPDDGVGGIARIPLHVGGEHLAELGLNYRLDLDHDRKFLKVVNSEFALYSNHERSPLIRLDYVSDANNAPSAHWQFHAERGALSHLLARAHAFRPSKVRTSHDLSRLHFPVGGDRFRPCIEDFLELLVSDIGVDSRPQWRSAVRAGRAEWQRKQLAAAVRDAPADAAAALQRLGWHVQQPSAD